MRRLWRWLFGMPNNEMRVQAVSEHIYAAQKLRGERRHQREVLERLISGVKKEINR